MIVHLVFLFLIPGQNSEMKLLNKNMQLILTGGGDEHDSRPMDEFLIKLIQPGKKILYIPIAQNGDLERCRIWFESAFTNLEFNNYEMWVHLRNKTYKDIDEFGGIYIGGGNTFSLLYNLRITGFDEVLLQFISSGRPVYGGSAGAIIFGKTIETATLGRIIDNNHVGLNDKAGFNLVCECAIHCHYEDAYDSYIRSFVLEKGIPVIALGECSGLFVTNTGIKVIGVEPVYLFKREEKITINVNHIFK